MVVNFLKKIQSVGWSTKRTIWLLTAVLALQFFVYDFNRVLLKPPQSVHVWRQTDCASQALNYAQRDARFFKPQIHGLVSENYTSGYCMQEFPIIYYTVGMLYKIFGYNPLLFRATNLLIFIIALYFLFGLHKRTIGSNFWSLALTVLLFTSPVLVFYANNFIMNTPALAVTIVAWYFFFGYLISSKHWQLIVSMVLFTLGAVLKLSELISVLTIAGIIFLDYFRIVRFKGEQRLFPNPYPVAIYTLLAVGAVFVWYRYTHFYNELHGQAYYIYTTRHLLSLPPDLRGRVVDVISEYWVNYYQNRAVLWLYALTMLFNLLFVRRANPLYMAISLIMLVGSALYLFLFYGFLLDHDYYIISLYITTIFSTLTLVDILIRNYPSASNHWATRIAFVALLVYSVHYADKKMSARYRGWENSNIALINNLQRSNSYFDEIGVARDAKIISIPDCTPNLSLYLLNRRGWSSFISGDPAQLIALGKDRGAEYLVITDPRMLTHDAIIPHTYHKIGEFGSITIFKLDGVPNNEFDLSIDLDTITWDMETLSADGQFVISDSLYMAIPSTGINSSYSFSGSRSLRVSPGHYALNLNINPVVENKKYIVRLKRFAQSPSTSNLAICVSSPNEFYLSVSQGVAVDTSGWEQMEVQFRVPIATRRQLMSVNFYNANDFDVYIDDFSIAMEN